MKYKKEEYSRFKHLLEYFVAHLEYIANGDSTSIGYEEYIKPLVDRNSFKSSGQGYNGQAIQTQVSEWEKYQNGIICINVYGPNYQSRGTYLNWKETGANIMADWNSTHIETLLLVYYEPDSGERLPQNVSFTIKDLGLFDGQVPNENICSFFDKYNIMIENIKNKQHKMEINRFIELLKANSNLILTGAPGTGKTYLAKQIAAEMLGVDDIGLLEANPHYGFVQFHPSYDYTDFVEGLRPINHDNVVGFERKDGAFKEFCAEALNIRDTTNFDECIDKLFDSVGEEILLLETPTGKQFGLSRSARGNLRLHTGKELKESGVITKKDLRAEYSGIPTFKWWKGYYQGILTYLTNNYNLINDSNIIEDNTPHVFIIDEINRGEISKIFGELFFSIDPGYRGEKGKVNTQYQNMIEDGDVFKNGFYVPENVYIIGTMNDIDRSVESMDFAMRRRFAWQEVTAEESYENMIENDSEFNIVKDEIKSRMYNLNKAIAETEGLDEAYQIGAAYFRKYLDYQDKDNPFDCLWENHLKGLLFEYLRGNRRAKELLEKLHEAYNKTSIDE